ncbi:MAG TPA: membrane protein insertase YidC [Gammaproteobacteria bacterium]|nr:membrane protein insertase YidC [Gammaproteobacteria bacterium]
MEHRRIILYIALMAILFALWQAWQKDYPPTSAVVTTPAGAPGSVNVPPVSASQQAAANNPAPTPAAVPTGTTIPTNQSLAGHPLIHVNTDVFHATIDTQGGNVVQINLPKYPESLDTPNKPVQILNNDPNVLFVAQTGLIGPNGPDTQTGQAIYTPQQTEYELAPNQNELNVSMTWQSPEGVKVTKTFTFKRGKYDVHVNYQIDNQSPQPWVGQLYAQLRQKPPTSSSGLLGLHTYNGAALSTTAEPYEKISYSKLGKENLDRTSVGGWLAMQQRYFLTSWIPSQSDTNHFYSRTDADGTLALGFVGKQLNVPPGKNTTAGAILYAGPELADDLKALAPHLDLTIDYGWLWPISVAILWVMKHIHAWIGNWGWSIVIVTLLIKLLFYKLSETSYRSMAKMRKLTPKIQAIKDRYGDDKQKMSQATMELYKKEKVNPLTGCLPMIVQIPFFIALYYVLIESVELRQAPFILWIHDLSVHDPYYVLPVLMGLSMWLQQRLNPPPPDPVQAKVMMLLPVIFTVFFLSFPAGLVLYWLVNNCLSVLQQWYITRKMEKSVK